jgi:hypothetical protein
MEKLQAIGAPFNIKFSSCSDVKPKLFEWTEEEQPIKVFIDGGIISGLGYEKKPEEKKIAWVCESRSIFHTMHMPRDSWEKNIENICEHYDIVFTSEKSMLSSHPKIQFAFAGSNLPWSKPLSNNIEKTKFCSMVSSAKNYAYGHRLRHVIAETYKDYIDLYGGIAGSEKTVGVDRWDKTQGILDYMFTFVVENDSYSTYYTEKLTDAFKMGTIPVYWGAPDIGEHFNIDGMVILHKEFDIRSLTKELYESKLDAVIDNYNRVKNLEMSDDYLYRKIKEYAN